MTNRRRITGVAKALEGAYGVPRPRGRKRDPLDWLVLTVLSQNTNDRNRDRAWEALKAAFPDWSAVIETTPKRLAAVIAPAGLHRQKARTIRQVLSWTWERYGLYSLEAFRDIDTETLEKSLLAIRGVGIKTVYVVLAMCLGRDVFPMDTHCLRLLIRLGFLPEKTALDKAHRLMAGHIPKGMAFALHLNLITHGRKVCSARSPVCGECVLKRRCPSKGTGAKAH